MAKDENPNLALRITVESGGCHGFQYLMSLTTLPPLTSFPDTSSSSASIPQESGAPALNTSSSDHNAIPSDSPTSPVSQSESNADAAQEVSVDEDDTVFKALDGSEAKVVMDGPSLELLKGSRIDYTMELIGSQFKIVDNPLATSSCGCGTSFDIKA
jgi:Fe-S cluster assembly iron-binding protein IscA